ncbi:MAG TPA: hypothetical protein DER01_12605, partial [Phycisphaerales bacterium]|nr:hypothetical protein [Phycisphaerales bacterium]
MGGDKKHKQKSPPSRACTNGDGATLFTTNLFQIFQRHDGDRNIFLADGVHDIEFVTINSKVWILRTAPASFDIGDTV